jgi:hypothetical protein
MNTNTTTNTWIRRVAAGAVLAAAPALIALGTATASHAESGTSTGSTSSTSPGYKYSPTQTGPLNGQYPWHNTTWDQGSFHHRHAAEQQSRY